MCIIIHSKHGDLINKDELYTAYENNPHGFGLMWAEGGRVQVHHDVCDFDTIWETLLDIEGIPHALHFRWVTRGELTLDQCHPFQVTDKDQSGRDIFMMHNGTLYFLNSHVQAFSGRKSDTQIFAEHTGEILRSKSDPRVLFSERVQSNMHKRIRSHNKMLFLTDEGEWHYFNRNQGAENEDFWVSNVYSFEPGYRGKSTAAIVKPRKGNGKGKKKGKKKGLTHQISIDEAYAKGYVVRRGKSA